MSGNLFQITKFSSIGEHDDIAYQLVSVCILPSILVIFRKGIVHHVVIGEMTDVSTPPVLKILRVDEIVQILCSGSRSLDLILRFPVCTNDATTPTLSGNAEQTGKGADGSFLPVLRVLEVITSTSRHSGEPVLDGVDSPLVIPVVIE